ncbi:lactate utilization protein C [Georgenia sp. TF02-10]|uniref:LutC/YkgG family protein n=1 Tax=Georgenia sp. TF02-10 TaxID=2917725 RepID=UPI001FA6D180|nr:lactate utilization protein C [Georgenia sp. TF02-10]UNX55403.1 lactate utilization protein C [Georgenia sp. TF02-10]
MGAREAILARIRDANGRASATPVTIPREYDTDAPAPPGSPQVVATFVDRLEDYRARVHHCDDDGVGGVLAGLLTDAGTVVVPPGLPTPWHEAVAATGTQVRTDNPPLSNDELDTAGAVLTAARLGIAVSGVIVLDGEPDQGRRAISLVPDHHVCVIRRDQVLATVPQAVTDLAEHPTRPLTWIAGPSATSDIELVRVEGVHGPHTLDVIIVG